MNQTAPQEVTTVARIQHAEAMRIAAVENRKFGQQLRSFDAADWDQPTDCERWDVRAQRGQRIRWRRRQRSKC